MKQRFILLLFILFYHSAYTQGYEGSPCGIGGNFPKEFLQKKQLKDIKVLINECMLDGGQLYTSMLKASGKAPLSVKDPNFKPPPDWSEADGDEAYDSWTCMYSGGRAVDGSSSTAWVEGVEGHGKGELIVITKLDLSKRLEILSGFGKSQALFVANNRPKTINIHIVRALPAEGGESQCGTFYAALKIISTSKVVLKDINQFQSLPIPAFKMENYPFQGEQRDYSYWLMIEIIDVYPGTKYNDTCISEIRNVK
jgi:hypothetical protein